MSMILLITIIIVVVFGVTIISIYNSLVSRKNTVDYANGAVDAMYKQRYDLIPNLVAVVKQYMQHESGLLEKLTLIRQQGAASDLTDQQKAQLDSKFADAVKSFNISVENYPDLKAGQQFTSLQSSLNECEAQLSAARRTYNAAVMEYNNALEMFPSNIIAGMMNYHRKETLTATQTEKQVPDTASLFKQ